MSFKFNLTTPPAAVQEARLAMARAEQRLARDIGPMEPCPDLTGICLAFLTLEEIYPAYPPLFDVGISADPRADLAAAVSLLTQAIADADTVADVIRYALTIRDLHDLDLLALDRADGQPLPQGNVRHLRVAADPSPEDGMGTRPGRS